MLADLSDHPFSPQNIALESGAADRSERAWLRWIAQAETLIGHDLDGNDVKQAGCGYSLDEALDVFEAGSTPAEYVATVKARARYQPAT